MATNNSEPMTAERFAAILAAHGGSPSRWPQAERAAAEQFLASSPDAQRLQSEALALDRALANASKPVVSTALERRLLESFDRVHRRTLRSLAATFADALWPGAPIWQPVFVLALALAIGVCIALMAPLDIATTDEGVGNVFAFDGVPAATRGI